MAATSLVPRDNQCDDDMCWPSKCLQHSLSLSSIWNQWHIFTVCLVY